MVFVAKSNLAEVKTWEISILQKMKRLEVNVSQFTNVKTVSHEISCLESGLN